MNKEYIKYVEKLDKSLERKKEFELKNSWVLKEYDELKKDIEIQKNLMKALGNNTYQINNTIYETKIRKIYRFDTKSFKNNNPDEYNKHIVESESPIVYVKKLDN